MYDSGPETQTHINRVRALIYSMRENLMLRALAHDLTKLQAPEKPIFDEFTPKLKGSTYGSDEYKQFLAAMKPALDHHYKQYPHHPEHYTNGVNGMSLLDLLEMFCDWKAATERHADGSLVKSIEINTKRFNITPQLAEILENTRKELGW